jgi:hypothetical protein
MRSMQRGLSRRRLQQLFFPRDAGAGEMRVQVDQARQESSVPKIDDARIGRDAGSRPRRRNPVAADHDDPW